MTVEFSHHVLEKAKRRDINISCIYQTLEAPDALYEDIEHRTLIAVKKTNNRSVILAYGRKWG